MGHRFFYKKWWSTFHLGICLPYIFSEHANAKNLYAAKRYMGRTTEVHPGTVSLLKNRIQTAHRLITIVPKKTANPKHVINRSGTTENDVIASSASATILRNGYFDFPANRVARV